MRAGRIRAYFLRKDGGVQHLQFPLTSLRRDWLWLAVHVSEEPGYQKGGVEPQSSPPCPGWLSASPHSRVWACPGWAGNSQCPSKGVQSVWRAPNWSETSYTPTGERQSLYCCELPPEREHHSPTTPQTTEGIYGPGNPSPQFGSDNALAPSSSHPSPHALHSSTHRKVGVQPAQGEVGVTLRVIQWSMERNTCPPWVIHHPRWWNWPAKGMSGSCHE